MIFNIFKCVAKWKETIYALYSTNLFTILNTIPFPSCWMIHWYYDRFNSASIVTTPVQEPSQSTSKNLSFPLSNPMRRMSTYFMDKMMSPLGSRRNSAATRNNTVEECDFDMEKDSNPSSEAKQRRKDTLSPEDPTCKQYVQTIEEDNVKSPTQGCSTCIDCTM